MPTVVGDVVVERATPTAKWHTVWTVMGIGEQAARPIAYISCALGVLGAIAIARMMVGRKRSTDIYVVEQDTDTWTKLSRSPVAGRVQK